MLDILSDISMDLLPNCEMSKLPSSQSMTSAAGHSGLFTAVNKSCTKFSNKGRKSSSPFIPHFCRNLKREGERRRVVGHDANNDRGNFFYYTFSHERSETGVREKKYGHRASVFGEYQFSIGVPKKNTVMMVIVEC